MKALTTNHELSAAKRVILERRLRGATQASDHIWPRTPGAVVPMSAEQEHVWLHAAMAPEVPLYNEAFTIRRSGECDPGLLTEAFNEFLRRHEIWRTAFCARDGAIVQLVHDPLAIDLPFSDLSSLPEAKREAEAIRLATEDVRLLFDLSRAPLLRGRIVKLSAVDHRLYVAIHHIIFDGISINNVLLPELAAIYADIAAGFPAAAAGPAPPRLQYGDYAVWRASKMHDEAIRDQFARWSEMLAGELPVLRLPTDHSPQALPMHHGSMHRFTLGSDLNARLKALSQSLNVTFYSLLLASFQTLLFRYTSQTDLLVGNVVDMRRRRELEPVLGYFLNTLPVRTRPAGGMPFSEYVRQSAAAVLGMLDACDVPLTHLVRALRPRRDTSHPLFQVLFSMQPPVPTFEGWDLTQMDVAVGTAKFELYLEIEHRGELLEGRFLYSTDLFEPATIHRMEGHWRVILEAITADPTCALQRLPLLTAAEIAEARVWNDTARPLPVAPLHELVDEQARRAPHAVAIDTAERSFSYLELTGEVDRIAGWLTGAGVLRGMVVAVCLERGYETVASLTAVMKAGAAYMPLDPSLPSERLDHWIKAAAAPVLLTQAHLLKGALHASCRVLLLNDGAPWSADPLPMPKVQSDDLAYVLCTSGTTGEPKAVEITHRSLVNLLLAMQEEPGFQASDSLLAVTTVSFDIAALELFLPLVSGGRLILASRDVAADPFRLANMIERMRPTVMQATPSMWRALLDAGWAGLTGLKVLVGGEALPRDLGQSLLQRNGSVWNMYGPTETTIWSTVHRVQAGDAAVPIGRPIANTTAFVLDMFGNQLPVGVPGELHIGGAGVARGYRNQPSLTQRRFVVLDAGAPYRVYRTGDVVRRLTDGTLDWLGRNDDQVKIRGHRVEPSEIEAAINGLPGADGAAVVACNGPGGILHLVAHVVSPTLDAVTLREELARRLPDYMLPGRFVVHETLPLTSNGKIDRAILAERWQDAPSQTRKLTDLEQQLAAIWQILLGLDHINPADDFFALGGHSLLAINLLTRIAAEFRCQLTPAALFQSSTLEHLARLVERSGPFVARGSVGPEAAITLRLVRSARATSRGVVLGMPGLFGHAANIAIIAANSLAEYDVWTFAIDTVGRKLTENDAWLGCAFEIANRLIAKPEFTPRAIIGFSIGGFMAWFVERLLVAAGRETIKVINFDGGTPPNEESGWRTRVSLLLNESVAPPPRMLLLRRQQPGRFGFVASSDTEWTAARALVLAFGYPTLDHLDVVLPAAITAAAGALQDFIEGRPVAAALCSGAIEFDTVGGRLFRMLDRDAPPDVVDMRVMIEASPLSNDGTSRLALLFIALVTGDARLALDLAARILAAEPGHRAATYTKIAALSELDCEVAAGAAADAWCRDHPDDLPMRTRARRTPRELKPWAAAAGLALGSDASLDFAASLKIMPLRGYIDLIDSHGVEGWAQTETEPDVPVSLDVLIDGVVVARTLANNYRDDLKTAGLLHGKYGFKLHFATILTKREQATVIVRRTPDHVALTRVR